MLTLLHRLFQFFLVVSEQGMDFPVSFITDGVNLRAKRLTRNVRILVEERLNLIVVLLKQRPDLLLLFQSQLQILSEASELLIDRLRRVDMLQLLMRRRLLCPVILGYGGNSASARS
jgi:hypothetical protein